MPEVPVLEVRDLRTYFHTERVRPEPSDGVSFTVGRGRTLAVVGESGCGKTVTALSILKLLNIAAGRDRLGPNPCSTAAISCRLRRKKCSPSAAGKPP